MIDVCALCGKEIPDGEQVAMWDTRTSKVQVTFICKECGKSPPFEDITAEVTGHD